MKNDSLLQIAAEIRERDTFTILGHITPDGDCIGSLVALHLALTALGKVHNVLLRDEIPANYGFLTGVQEIQRLSAESTLYDTIIFADCGDMARAGEDCAALLAKQPHFILNIDHHGTNAFFGNRNYVDAGAAACAEILAELIPALGIRLTPEMADALYTGILMDSGNFQYSSTTSRTLRTAAQLLDAGANLDRIRVAMFESKDPREIQMLSLALRHMQRSEDGTIAWMYLTLEELRSIQAEDYHPEGLVNYLRSIVGVKAAVHFRETGANEVKIAFRSKDSFDISKTAVHFGGGGHPQASGARFAGTLEEAIQTVIPYLAVGLKEYAE